MCAIQDNNALTYVMTYSVNDEGFEKTTKKCPANFQCFRNKKDDKRLIVPPYKKKYAVSSVLGNRYKGHKGTDGIMLATYNGKEGIWEYKVMNGKTYGEKNSAYLAGATKLLLLPR